MTIINNEERTHKAIQALPQALNALDDTVSALIERLSLPQATPEEGGSRRIRVSEAQRELLMDSIRRVETDTLHAYEDWRLTESMTTSPRRTVTDQAISSGFQGTLRDVYDLQRQLCPNCRVGDERLDRVDPGLAAEIRKAYGS